MECQNRIDYGDHLTRGKSMSTWSASLNPCLPQVQQVLVRSQCIQTRDYTDLHYVDVLVLETYVQRKNRIRRCAFESNIFDVTTKCLEKYIVSRKGVVVKSSKVVSRVV